MKGLIIVSMSAISWNCFVVVVVVLPQVHLLLQLGLYKKRYYCSASIFDIMVRFFCIFTFCNKLEKQNFKNRSVLACLLFNAKP